MEEERNGTNNYDLLSDREGPAIEIVLRINRHITAQLERGMVWRNLVSQRTGDMLYFLDRLAQATGTDHSSESEDVSQPAVEGFERQIISGVGVRCMSQGHRFQWRVERIWDTVDINHIRVAENYEWRPVSSNVQRDVRITSQENITIWWRVVKDWSRLDENILSIQTLWSGNFSYSERLLQLLEDVNTVNSIQILNSRFILHPDMRRQYIARCHETNRVAAAYSFADSTVFSTRGGEDADGNGLFCAICQENISIGKPANQLPCNHFFHYGCTIKWFLRQLSCPLCRYDFPPCHALELSRRV